jgi:hypothetical protein
MVIICQWRDFLDKKTLSYEDAAKALKAVNFEPTGVRCVRLSVEYDDCSICREYVAPPPKNDWNTAGPETIRRAIAEHVGWRIVPIKSAWSNFLTDQPSIQRYELYNPLGSAIMDYSNQYFYPRNDWAFSDAIRALPDWTGDLKTALSLHLPSDHVWQVEDKCTVKIVPRESVWTESYFSVALGGSPRVRLPWATVGTKENNLAIAACIAWLEMKDFMKGNGIRG